MRGEKETLAVAIVGYGYWGMKHARVFASLPDVELHVVDVDPVRRKAAGENAHVRAVAPSLEELPVAVDAAVVATPPSTHVELGRSALSNGMHVLIEKPLAMRSDECKLLVKSADHAGRVLMAGHTFEFHSGVRRLRQLVQDGAVGDVFAIDSARLGPGPYRADIDVLWDLAPHDVSIANMILGSTPQRVQAMGRDLRGSGRLDMVHFELEYDDPSVVMYGNVSLLNPDKVRRVTVIGSESVCVLNDMSQDPLRVYYATEGAEQIPNGEVPIRFRFGDVYCPLVEDAEPLLEEATHFIESIRAGTQPRSDGKAGMQVVRVLEAIEEAIHTGQAVEIEDVEG